MWIVAHVKGFSWNVWVASRGDGVFNNANAVGLRSPSSLWLSLQTSTGSWAAASHQHHPVSVRVVSTRLVPHSPLARLFGCFAEGFCLWAFLFWRTLCSLTPISDSDFVVMFFQCIATCPCLVPCPKQYFVVAGYSRPSCDYFWGLNDSLECKKIVDLRMCLHFIKKASWVNVFQVSLE